MDTIKDKIKNLDQRISDVSEEKDEVTLEDCFTDELKEILTQKFNTELDLDKVDRSHRK